MTAWASEGTSSGKRVELEEIVVTGSRLRGVSGPSTVTVFDRARIEELGAATVADLLKYLPQQPFTRAENFRFGAAQFVEMRGIGADMTLVLINGRRAVTSAPQIASNAFDLNTLPLSAVERVDVLSDGASAIYGADAVGGVVNIVLKSDIDEPQLDLRYGTAKDGAEERRASLGAGVRTDRFSGTVALDWFDRQFLLGETRERLRNQDYTRFGSVDYRSPNANPGNVTSPTSANLPGLPSRTAAVQAGSTGVGLTPQDFLDTAGMRNLESLQRYQSIVPEAERASALVTGTFEVDPALTLFAEGMYTDRSSAAQSTPSSLNGMLVPASNPFNPFGVPVRSNFLLTGIGPRESIVETQSVRTVGGARGALGAWDWELSYLYSDEDGKSWTQNAASAVRVVAALGATDPTQALNPFQDGPGGSQALLRSLVAAPVVNRYASQAQQVSGFVRGRLGELPAGPLEVVLGGEYREEDVLFDGVVFVDAGRTVSAAFGEMRIPLVSDSMRIPAVHGLSLTLAARQDEYSDFGRSFSPQYGLTWLPAQDFSVRATYGKSFRPPSLFELYSPQIAFDDTPVIDPRRNDELAMVTAIIGGNPDLQPIQAASWTAGIAWSPRALSGLTLKTTYWRIELEDRVRAFSEQLVLANEALFPERVVRAKPTPADLAAGLPGAVLSVDTSNLNFGKLKTDGVDLDMRWSLSSSWGSWLPSLTATWLHRYDAGQAPGTLPVDRIDVANLEGTILRWRMVGGVSWQRDVWGAAINARYIPAYDDANAIGERTGRHIDDQVLIDAHVSLDFRRGSSVPTWLKGLSLQAGITNLFDEAPPFAEIGAPLGYDLSQGDLRQRFGYINLSKRF